MTKNIIDLSNIRRTKLRTVTIPEDSLAQRNRITPDPHGRTDRFVLWVPVLGDLFSRGNHIWFPTYIDADEALVKEIDRYRWRLAPDSSEPGTTPYVGGGPIRLHRFVLQIYGVNLDGKEVHHVNQIRYDNRITNLQVLAPEEHKRLPKRSPSQKPIYDPHGFSGFCLYPVVTLRKGTKVLFHSRSFVLGISLGCFEPNDTLAPHVLRMADHLLRHDFCSVAEAVESYIQRYAICVLDENGQRIQWATNWEVSDQALREACNRLRWKPTWLR